MKACNYLICLLMMLLLGACSDNSNAPDTVETVWHEKKVVVILPQSDGMGEHWQRVFSLFSGNAENAFRGQADGIRLSFEYHDESTEDIDALAEKIATRDDVYAVIGGLYSSNASRLASRLCRNGITFLTLATTEGPELLDFRFNGWGGKFEASLDNAINAHLVEGDTPVLKGKYVDCLDFELEGGSVEVDGLGTLLTTSECLLNPNRNAQLDNAHKEALLKERLGVNRVLWLDHGYLAGDDTDSHIDTLARLAPDNTIIYVGCDDPVDEHFAELRAMRSDLRAMRSASGEPFNLVELPLPDAIYDGEGNRLPATYANFLIVNNGVLVPVYNQPKKDRLACQIIRVAFPGHEIVPVDCRALIQQHGSLHCATMQIP